MNKLTQYSATLALLLSSVTTNDAVAQTYDLYPESSSLGFEVETSAVMISGQFETFNAEIQFDPDNLGESFVRATVPMASVSTGNSENDANLKKRIGLTQLAIPKQNSHHKRLWRPERRNIGQMGN